MKKIAIIGTLSAEMLNFRRDLIKELVKQGHMIFCFAVDYSQNDKDTIQNWGAQPVDYSFSPRGLNPFKDIKSTILLSKTLKQLEPDIVFNFFVKPVIFGTLAAYFAKVPRIIGMLEGLGNAFTEHQQGPQVKARILKKIQILLYRIALPKLDRFILLNKDDKKDLIKKYQIKIKSCEILGGIGVDLEEFAHSPVMIDSTIIKFLFIGRLLKEKGIFEYIEAARKVKAEFPNAEFIVLGRVESDNPFGLKQSILDMHIKDGIIEYPGYVSNIAQWLQECHVFVLPSYREGIPKSIQEATSVGRAIITTDSPGCRDSISDGVNGFLVKPFSTNELVEKMLYFIQNPTQITNMGNMSRNFAEQNYDTNTQTKKLVKWILKE